MEYRLANENEILSPALIYYADAILENTKRAIDIAGSAERLWPHVKSHKIREMVEMQRALGISRFKCATVVEADMVASCGANHVLLAYPMIGPVIGRFLSLAEKYPDVHFSAIVDSEKGLFALSEEAGRRNRTVDILIDVNLGMDRTGISPESVGAFLETVKKAKNVRYKGLHCYDGHVHDTDPAKRQEAVDKGLSRIRGIEAEIVIAGGSKTFPCYAKHEGLFLSPGTVFVWDYGYKLQLPDLHFVPAGAVLGRVVSHPAAGLFTIDVGSKAISADTAGQRGWIVGMEDKALPVSQSEEHWVWRIADGAEVPDIGEVVYVLPNHICPTTALYDRVYAARGGNASETWRVAARDRA
ncbi:MAG: D-TA family PLP-dependent enzyme [Christensenellales bacterium]|jgi:D-serine deaminase-like pyridoxal phosphate-dependent protein